LESFYENAFCLELELSGISFQRQKPVSIFYRDNIVGEHRLDLLVAERVVVEIKAIKSLEDIHFAIVRSYMKSTDVETGLLLNFATMPLTIKRVGREHNPQENKL